MSAGKRRDRFPLWLHPSGQWCKKYQGTFHDFGTDRDAALRRFAAEWDDIRAGRPRPPTPVESLTVRDLCNTFLTAKREQVDSGELSGLSWTGGAGVGGG
jgi:hypothetical protein